MGTVRKRRGAWPHTHVKAYRQVCHNVDTRVTDCFPCIAFKGSEGSMLIASPTALSTQRSVWDLNGRDKNVGDSDCSAEHLLYKHGG